eukprot:10454421-Alexandrium_andersonii.AAC.1
MSDHRNRVSVLLPLRAGSTPALADSPDLESDFRPSAGARAARPPPQRRLMNSRWRSMSSTFTAL